MAFFSYGLLASAALVTSVLGTPSIDIAICASANTATTASNTSIYQSDGLCFDFCSDSYAYALLSGTECWCSNITPSKDDQVDTSKCSGSCAGYPSDWCGGDGFYAYMAVGKTPSGTAGAASSAAPSSSAAPKTKSTSSSSSSTSKSTSLSTSTSTTPTTSSTSSPTTFSTSIIAITKTTSVSTSATVQTVTAAGGIVQTVTVTPASSPTASAGSSSHKSVSTGAAVGIAVGVVGAAVLGGIAAFLLWRRKRRERDAIYAEHNSKANSPRGTTPNASSPKVSEVSTGGPFADQSGRRRSALMPIDPRIDPAFSGIYARTGDNKSRDSVNSLRDDHDYSRRVHQPERVLRAMNPDPEHE